MRAILATLAGIALVVAVACAIPLPSRAATTPAPPASAHTQPAESSVFAVPHDAAMPPNSDVITPFDCGSAYCTLPKAGWANVFRVMADKDKYATQLELEVIRLRDALEKSGPRRCATVEPLPK